MVPAMEDAIFTAMPHMSDLFPSHGQHREAFVELFTAVVTHPSRCGTGAIRMLAPDLGQEEARGVEHA